MDNRHQFRADWHDYNDGIYFVTVCVHQKEHLLGEISKGMISLSTVGRELLKWIEYFSKPGEVEIWNHVIMPNHFHLIVSIKSSDDTDAQNRVPTDTSSANVTGCLKPPRHGEACDDNHHNSRLSVFVGNLKGGITRYANNAGIEFKWQPRFHEHIIRTQHSFDNIMAYIDNNVDNWAKDCFNND